MPFPKKRSSEIPTLSKDGSSRTTSASSIAAARKNRFSLERLNQNSDDPLTTALAPDADETVEERMARLVREKEDLDKSERIDRELAEELKEKRRAAKSCHELEVLLLGPTGAGKSTFLKQMRLQYDSKGLNAERDASRLVILLSIVQSTRALLSLLEGDTAASTALASSTTAPNPFRPMSPGGQDPETLKGGPRNEQEANYRRRIRLAPLLGLETQLRDTLGVIASGPSAPSLTAHAIDRSDNNVSKLGWRDSVPLEISSFSSADSRNSLQIDDRDNTSSADVRKVEKDRRYLVRLRAASPNGVEREPIFAPNFAEKLGTVAFGHGKESRRARAQATTTTPTPAKTNGQTVNPDGTLAFVAPPEDPIHLLAALKDEVLSLWNEAVTRGLVAGEGHKEKELGGFEMNESGRYFLSNLDRIARPEWFPTDDDILNVRVRTLGIETHRLQVTPTNAYKVVDVAGARGVKHSWAPFFDNAAAIIFIAAVSDYSIADPKDPRQNRLRDALDLFEDIATNPILKNVTMIVFLNKCDILRKRLKSGLYPLEKYMPRYPGGTGSGNALKFFQEQFERRHDKRGVDSDGLRRPVYTWATQANNTQSIRFVVAAVQDILMRSTLAASGLL